MKVSNGEGLWQRAKLSSRFLTTDEKFLNSGETQLPDGCDYDVSDRKPGSVRMAELAGMEKKLMEMKEARKKENSSEGKG